MLWIVGFVWHMTGRANREPRDSARHEMVNVIRNCPDDNGFAPIR